MRSSINTHPQEAHPSMVTCHMTYGSSKLVKQLLRYSNFLLIFHDVGHLPSLICVAHFVMTHKSTWSSLALSQNVVEIA